MLKLSNEGIFNNAYTLLKGKDAEVPKKQGLLSVCAGIYAG